MPVVSEMTLLPIDAALRCVGGVVLGWWMIRASRRGELRNPLAGQELVRVGPGPLMVGAVFLVFVLLLTVAALVCKALGVDADRSRIPGSGDWHALQVAQDVAKLLISLLMVAIAARCRPFPAGSRFAGGAGRLWKLAAGGVLVLLAVVYLQLYAGQIVWHWLQPDAVQPVHVVLRAFQESAWGRWGAVQLLVSALVIAPVSEELFFRGMLLGMFWRISGRAWLSVALSAVGFGLIHASQPQAVLPLATMGLILGYLRLRYRSLTLCVLIHALFNARTMIVVLLNPDLAGNGW